MRSPASGLLHRDRPRPSVGLGAGQHLPGVGAGFGRDVDAAQHAREFLAARLVAQGFDMRVRSGAVGLLDHSQVLVTLRRDLRQVGHAEHLTALAQRP